MMWFAIKSKQYYLVTCLRFKTQLICPLHENVLYSVFVLQMSLVFVFRSQLLYFIGSFLAHLSRQAI